jgi:hypothetical protein
VGGQTYAQMIANEAAADSKQQAETDQRDADFMWRFNQHLKNACGGTPTARDIYAARPRQLIWR